MKHLRYYLCILAIAYSCNAQHNQKPQKNMKTFDVQNFNKKKDEENLYNYVKDGFVYEESGGLLDQNYIRMVYRNEDLFKKFYRFYPDGSLKIKGQLFKKKFNSGLWEYFDENGNLIKKTNWDKPFTYSWEDIQKYLQAHEVDDIKKQVIDISRHHNENQTTWTLEFNGIYNKIPGRYVITLDGKTGEELEVKLFKGKGALGKSGTIAVYDTIYKKN